MAILPICKYPDPVLAEKCAEIDRVDDELRRLAQDMIDTMYDAPGVGLAAPQVGRAIRMVVVDTAEDDKRGTPMVLINPRVVAKRGQLVWDEACLSVPDYRADVVRASEVVVEAGDLEGNDLRIEAEGLTAVCLQHEIDHLDGVLFLDHISSLKRAMYRKRRLKQLRRDGQ
ncbi:peptide deformylase [Desulfarculus baarsii DSM 2075]|uniref:Peptide deformylase n=1 Tax=Desulfarculus baarsii (strain ATCC 33931 / DSM 2075 / LMG 7858 / VKM B-1802 / 2st14) TaxID=644282 RepID=E1QDU0_DESB2|nr:peptide deformylase [Desulfarculus baarsii]ADK83726.1 peptide deformylase [Desulfarculus baarsii DSM 2075]